MEKYNKIWKCDALRRIIAFFLVVCMTFSGMDTTSFLVAKKVYANDSLSSQSVSVATSSNSSAETAQNTEAGSLTDGTLENDLTSSGAALRSYTGFYRRPSDGELSEIGDFKVQHTANGLVIWGFKDGFATENITIPDFLPYGGTNVDVVEIGEEAFAISHIDTVTFGQNLKKIGNFAFAGNQLLNVELPDSLEEIGKEAFRDNQITELELKHTKTVGDGAFFNNRIANLDLGDGLTQIGSDAFKNNLISEVTLPDTLDSIGHGAFSFNGKYVKLDTQRNPLPAGIPGKDSVSGGYGHVVRPVNITISYRDQANRNKIKIDTVLESDLTSENIYVLGVTQTFPIPQIPGYTPVLTTPEITFTPDQDNYSVDIFYEKLSTGLTLERDNTKKPMLAPFDASATTEDVKNALLDLIKAYDNNDPDMRDQVSLAPDTILESVKNAVEGNTFEVEYILTSNTGEQRRIRTKIYIGTNLLNFPLDNGWVLGDFVYGGQPGEYHNGDQNSVHGLSAQGMAKLNAGNRDLVLPHFNPYTNTVVDKVLHKQTVASGASLFGQKEFNTVRDFENSITAIGHFAFYDSKFLSAQFLNLTKIEYNAFQNNDRMTTFEAPKLEIVGSNAFVRNRALENIYLTSVKKIENYAFQETGLKKAILPSLEVMGTGAFWYSKIGADPSYPQGFYLPNLTTLPSHAFFRTQLTYVDRNRQMPSVTKIDENGFGESMIKTADLTGITDVGLGGFKDQKNPDKLTSLTAPDLVNIGRAGFHYNKIAKVDLPLLKTIGDDAFSYNQIAELIAPNLEEIGYQGFFENKLTKLQLPALIKAGSRAFGKNYIKEAFLKNIQELGVDAFFSDFWPNHRNHASAHNPGLAALDNFIPVFTDNLNMTNRENYIINPSTPTTDPWDEADFTWDAADTGKVTGLTAKGKAKLIAKEYRLEIPARATSIGDHAFLRSQVKSVEAPNVVRVGESAFAYNPLNRVDMPSLTEIGKRSFENNTSTDNNKLSNFDFSRVTSIGDGAFNNAGLVGNLSLPLVTQLGNSAFQSNALTYVDAPLIESIGVYTFYGNRITNGNFPLVKRVQNSGMMSNHFQGINAVNFPNLEFIEGRGFAGNPLKQLEFVKPVFIDPNQSMHINELDNPLVWQIPTTVTSTPNNPTAFTREMFAYTYRSFAPGSAAYAKPNIIMLTNAPNPDGSLNRGDSRGISEFVGSSTYHYNGAWINNVPIRSVVVDPSTVKVNFRVDQTNEAFDGQGGRPVKADYREYIYEELEPRNMATGAWQSARTFIAPVIPGYVLTRSEDADRVSVANRDRIEVPFEAQGSRTDREITFYYKKTETDLNPNVTLQYKIKKPSNSLTQPAEYVTEYKYESYRNHPEMLTFFDMDVLNAANITLQNPKLLIDIDSPFIDYTKTLVAEDASTSTLFDAGAWSTYPGGVTIDVKDNLQISAIQNVGVRFMFGDEAPNLAKATARVTLVDEVGGVQKIIAQSNPIVMQREYLPEPYLNIYEDHIVAGHYPPDYARGNGARNLGLMTGIDQPGGVRIIENPAPVPFKFSTASYQYAKIAGFSMSVEIGDYTAIDPNSNAEITRTPVFDPAQNPGWSREPDGTFRYTKTYPSPRYLQDGDLPPIYFSFPGMKENAPVTVKANMVIQHVDDPTTPEPAVTNTLRGDLGYGDSLSVYPIYVGPGIPFTGTDFKAEKYPLPTNYTVNGSNRLSPRGYTNNSYIYDYIDDRSMEIPYVLSVGSSNEMYDFRDVQVFDYQKDSRLKFKRLEFLQNAADVNTRVLVGGFRRTGANINPAADTMVLEQEVIMDRANKVYFPDNIDYIRIKVVGSESAPLKKTLQFKMVTELKDPTQDLLPADSILENASMTSAKIYKKETDELAAGYTKPNDPKFEHLDGNVFLENEAKVDVYEYKMNVALDKSLTYPVNAGSYPIYPAYGSGGEVLGGQAGAYHLSLNTSMGANNADRGANVLENFEIIDIFPDGMELKASDIVLYEKFVSSGGRFEIIGEYPVQENGVTRNYRAIRFYTPRLDLYQYGDQKFVIATIKTRFLGDTDFQKITNRAYASWTPKQGVEAQNVFENAGQLLSPNGQHSTKPWSTDSESIKVTVASALSGHLKIRNKRDLLWTTSTKTLSEEKFDYRMSIRNLDSDQSRSYSNFEMVNILPGVNDNQLSKTGLRGSQFDEGLDLTRMNDLKVYIVKQNQTVVPVNAANYQIGFDNTSTPTSDLLNGKTIEEYYGQTTWAGTANNTTKALRVKFDNSITLGYGDELVVEVPMAAPNLTHPNNGNYDKKAVDSFSYRFTTNTSSTPLPFREVNNAENIMEAPSGSISFKKYGKVGTLTSAAMATPLSGAVFSISGGGITRVAHSDGNGMVTFSDLDVRHGYVIREIGAPSGYRISNQPFYINGMQTMYTATGYQYVIPDDDTPNGIKVTMMNVKPITGSITIKKKSADPNILLPNVSFTLRGLDTTNSHILQEVTTSDNGSVLIENLPEGRYTITEILSSQVNRFTDMGSQTVNITPTAVHHTVEMTNEIVQVLLKKVITTDVNDLDPANWERISDYGKTAVAGYRFKVTGADGSVVYTNDTNARGEVVVSNLKANMVYTVTEETTQNAPEHVLYLHNTNEYKFKVTPEGYVVNAANGTRFRQQSMNFPNMEKEITGKIVLQKHEEGSTVPIAGATFQLEKVEFAADGTIASAVQIGTTKQSEMVGANAQVSFDNLEPGSYRITETEPAPGYYFGSVNPNVIVTIPNKASSADLSNPRFSFNGSKLVYTWNESLANKKTKVIGYKGEDLTGYINIPTADAESFVSANPGYKVRRTGDGVASVYKPLANAVFELYMTNNGVKVGTAIPINGNTDIVSDTNGIIDFGDYKFVFDQEYGVFEKSAPVGYEKLAQPKVFKILEESARADFTGTYTFHMNNKKLDNSILVSKYDSITKRVLDGAVFGLYAGHAPITDSSVPIKQITTNAEGFAYFDELEIGDYTVREIQSPNGYRAPYDSTRDKQISITPTQKRHSYIAYNTKTENIRIKKQWMFGSEKAARVVLMRRAVNETNFTPVTGTVVFQSGETGSTALDGSVDLTVERGLEVVYPDLPQANADGRAYLYEVRELGVVDAAGNVFAVANSQVDNRYGVMITGNPGNGYQIQNVAVNPNRRNITVSKEWEFANGSTVALAGSKIVIALMQKVGSAPAVEYRRVTLDESNNWRHTFQLLEKRRNGEEVTYFVKEVNRLDGFSQTITEDLAQQTPNTNVFLVKNTAIKRNRIEFTKRWDGIDPNDAPAIFFDLYDSANMNTPMFSQQVRLQGGVYKAVFENVPSFAYTVIPNAQLPDLDPNKGRIESRKIKYVLKERYTDGIQRPAYTFTTDLNDDAFRSYSDDANIGSNLSFTVTNTMAKQNVKIVKTWEGVAPSDAPNVEVELYDITDDTTADHSDTANHQQIGTRRVLQYHADAAQSFTTVFENLPKYRPDGFTPIRYLVKQITVLPGYDTRVEEVITVDEQNKLGKIHSKRKVKNLQIKKQWEMTMENHPGANSTKPDVYVDILADMTDDGIVNPTAYRQSGLTTEGILLSDADHYEKSINGLNEYTNDGSIKIRYYLKERDLTGYIEPSDISAASENEGRGRIAVAEDATRYMGIFVNKQEKVNLYTELNWVGLERYSTADLSRLPRPTLEVWDQTDPLHPKRVRSAVPMVLTEDGAVPGRARWTAQMLDLPKFSADGTQAIVYEVVQTDVFTGYRSSATTVPLDAGGNELSIRDVSGNIIQNDTLRNGILADVKTWEARITNTVRLRDVSVHKTWEGRVGESATIHLLADGTRIHEQPNTPASPIVLREHNPGQHGTWNYTFRNLPYTKIDGNSVIDYTVEEDDIVNYTKRFVRTETDMLGREIKNIRYDVFNTFASIDITVKKSWENADQSAVPAVQMQLMDVTDISHPMPVIGMIATLDANNGFESVFENVPKFKNDGMTRIKYDVIEMPNLPGYRLSTDVTYSDVPTPTSEFGTARIEAVNHRIPVTLKLKKIWEDEIDGNRPEVEFLLYHDSTDDGLENPMPLHDVNGRALDLKLKASDGYETILQVPKYATDGTFEIKYFISEKPLRGYRSDVTDKLLLTASDASTLTGEIRNKIVPIHVRINATWKDMDVYKNVDRIPDLHVALYDVTDPANPKKIRSEAVLVKDVDGSYKTMFADVPKYRADGVTPIKYAVKAAELEDKRLPGYVGTYLEPMTDTDGNVTLSMEIRPRMRKVTVIQKTRGGKIPEVESYLHYKNEKVFPDRFHIGSSSVGVTVEVPYFEADGTTERKYMLFSYQPEDYLLDIEFSKVPQDLSGSGYTDLKYVLTLKKGRSRSGGGGGVVKVGSGSSVSSVTDAENDILTLDQGGDIHNPDSAERTIKWTDAHGKTITIGEKDRKKYTVDKTGRIVPKTGDDLPMHVHALSIGAGLLLVYLYLRRRRKEDEKS